MAGETLLTGSGTFFPKPPLIENRSGAGIVEGQQPRYPEVQFLSAHHPMLTFPGSSSVPRLSRLALS